MVKLKLTKEEYDVLKFMVEQKREMYLQKVKTYRGINGQIPKSEFQNLIIFSRLEVKLNSDISTEILN